MRQWEGNDLIAHKISVRSDFEDLPTPESPWALGKNRRDNLEVQCYADSTRANYVQPK